MPSGLKCRREAGDIHPEPDASGLLGERGVLALETEVLMIETENHPGVLGQMAHRLADAEVNIEYAYMAATLNSTKGLMILRPDDVKKAQQVLHDL